VSVLQATNWSLPEPISRRLNVCGVKAAHPAAAATASTAFALDVETLGSGRSVGGRDGPARVQERPAASGTSIRARLHQERQRNLSRVARRLQQDRTHSIGRRSFDSRPGLAPCEETEAGASRVRRPTPASSLLLTADGPPTRYTRASCTQPKPALAASGRCDGVFLGGTVAVACASRDAARRGRRRTPRRILGDTGGCSARPEESWRRVGAPASDRRLNGRVGPCRVDILKQTIARGRLPRHQTMPGPLLAISKGGVSHTRSPVVRSHSCAVPSWHGRRGCGRIDFDDQRGSSVAGGCRLWGRSCFLLAGLVLPSSQYPQKPF
jgi:hypothetical protein